MKIIVTGSSQGIGKAIAEKFLKEGHEVIGFDIKENTILSPNYTHIVRDLSDFEKPWPYLGKIDILINNVGVQSESRTGYDIDVNLKGAIEITEVYFNDIYKSVLFIGSVSAHSGFEFPEYVASKAGLIGYMKNVAMRKAKNNVTCNSLDPGGVITELNAPVLKDPILWNQIMDVTPLRRWATVEEIADWAYFLTVTQSFCTGQSIVVDGGEKDLNSHFIWPNFSN